METLPLFHRIAGQPVIVLGEGAAAEAKRRLVERAGGVVIAEIQRGIDEGARLAFIAHENDAAMESDAIRLRCAGLLVNVTDRPALCDFTVPSVLERGPVLVAVGTGGVSAGLAKALRLRLEALLPPSLGELAGAISALRERLRQWYPDPTLRRRALDDALAPGGALDLLDGGSAARARDWKPTKSGDSAQTSSVVEIVLCSPDPDDLTLRQARLLGSADAVCHEAAVPEAILLRARADAVRLPPGADSARIEGLVVRLTVRWDQDPNA